MRYRIGAWASGGFLVASFWALYLFPTSQTASEPILTLARLICPVASMGSYFHFGIRFYWCIVANAATYALVGLILETPRFHKSATQL
jgi:hypothetical protein